MRRREKELNAAGADKQLKTAEMQKSVDSVITAAVAGAAARRRWRNASDARSVVPGPARDEQSSADETLEDIEFQRKYLSMESAKAFAAFSFHFGAEGVSIEGGKIMCPSLVISAVNDEADDRRGRATARHIGGEYLGLEGTTHMGLLVGQRYCEAVSRMMIWLERFEEGTNQPSKPRLASSRPT